MNYYNKNGIIVRDSKTGDVEAMKDNLRQSDIDEIWASHHHTPEAALRLSVEMSVKCLTIEYKDKVISMFGIVPATLLAESATVWLLATDEFKKISKAIIKEGRKFIDLFLEVYPTLENYVDTRNVQSIKWLKMCGAKIEPPEPYGIDNILFHYFTLRRR